MQGIQGGAVHAGQCLQGRRGHGGRKDLPEAGKHVVAVLPRHNGWVPRRRAAAGRAEQGRAVRCRLKARLPKLEKLASCAGQYNVVPVSTLHRVHIVSTRAAAGRRRRFGVTHPVKRRVGQMSLGESPMYRSCW